jgi:hypothetical protein
MCRRGLSGQLNPLLFERIQSSGAIASLVIEENKAVQDIEYNKIREILIVGDQVLE